MAANFAQMAAAGQMIPQQQQQQQQQQQRAMQQQKAVALQQYVFSALSNQPPAQVGWQTTTSQSVRMGSLVNLWVAHSGTDLI
jgi:hypothetical protein